ncbi:hypothetical protein FDP41_013479 [Naegleria fowleri]|uniref:Ammonium transporter n=1 Tax=Naegleria fowleri TaxID=5763 RepID=A0A6A5C449_NAEFO|nr:uncharacterized protein FDP41_013479 [Naegleria fowleri]KAF0980265.1 hypothetical protein FDP41_013479 [Naegleria fowleri]
MTLITSLFIGSLFLLVLLLPNRVVAQSTPTTPTITTSSTTTTTLSATDVDIGWTLINGALVMFMQAGFAFLEAGSIRSKNVANILLKIVMSVAISTMAWFCIGYGFAYGDNQLTDTRNGFFGNSGFFLLGGDEPQHVFFFQWAFAAVASSIVSGAVAERMNLSAFFMCSFIMTAFIYAPVAHWIWSSAGWLSGFNKTMFRVGNVGVTDYAGGIVVHLVGGVCGLVGSIMVGPRIGRFVNGRAVKIAGHNKTLVLLGGLILWFGWYGFNSGSTQALSGGMSTITAFASANTTIAGAAGAMMCMLWSCLQSGQYDLTESLNGCLAGCVSITPVCAFVEGWAAVLIGASGALVYIASNWLLEALRIDDPVSAVPIHAFCGAWGLITGGLFATQKQIATYYGLDSNIEMYGLFYSLNWELLGVNLLGIAIVLIWTAFSSVIMFFIIDITIGLRVPPEDELIGLDHKYGGHAYTLDDPHQYGFGNSTSENTAARSALKTARTVNSHRTHRSGKSSRRM